MTRALAALALVIVFAPSASALDARSFPRASAPHGPTLGAALAAIIPGSIHIRHEGGAVIIEAASFAGVNLTSVQAAVDAAPADTPAERAKNAVDTTQGLPACLVEAMARALVPTLNQTRTDPLTPKAAITADAVRTSLKAQIDALGCGS